MRDDRRRSTVRRLLIAAALLALGAAVVLAVGAVSLNGIINRNRERILQQATATLGRPVNVGHIGVSLWRGLGVRLETVRIADDARFSDGDFVRAAALTVHAQLWPLLHGRLEVGAIDAVDLAIHLVRAADGSWNYSTLLPLSPVAQTASFRVMRAAYEPEAPTLPLTIAHLALRNATLIITDRRATPARTTQVTQIDLSLRDVSPATPIRFALLAALDAQARNIELAGTVGPFAESVPLTATGHLGPLGPRAVEVDDLQLTGALAPDAVRIEHLTGRSCGGHFTLSGQYPRREAAALLLKGAVTDVQVAELLRMISAGPPLRFEGAARATFDLRGQGADPAALQQSLNGQIVADVRDGVLRDVNIVNEVLGRVSGLPTIGTLVSANVKPKYARLFADADTHFETMHGTFAVGEQRVRTDDLTVMATDYGVRAAGWVGFDQQADLSGTLLMSKPFTTDLVADVKEAKYLTNGDGQLALPFRLRGQLGKAKPKVDSDYLIAALQRALLEGGAKSFVDKLLGGKRDDKGKGPDDTGKQLGDQLRKLFGR